MIVLNLINEVTSVVLWQVLVVPDVISFLFWGFSEDLAS
jgi:hypothetical protein